MKLLIEKFACDESVYASVITDKQWNEYKNNTIPQLNPPGKEIDASFLDEDHNCNLSNLVCGHLVFDLKKKKKKKKKRKKQKCSLIVKGKHITQMPRQADFVKPPKFVSSLTNYESYSIIRIDDENHPEFWLEVIIAKDK